MHYKDIFCVVATFHRDLKKNYKENSDHEYVILFSAIPDQTLNLDFLINVYSNGYFWFLFLSAFFQDLFVCVWGAQLCLCTASSYIYSNNMFVNSTSTVEL